MFNVLKVDGGNIVTDKGMLSLSPSSYADGGKTQPVGTEDYRKIKDMFLKLPALYQLFCLVQTIREEQVSVKMGFGSTQAEKRERANIYAAEIQRAASKIDEVLEVIAVNTTE